MIVLNKKEKNKIYKLALELAKEEGFICDGICNKLRKVCIKLKLINKYSITSSFVDENISSFPEFMAKCPKEEGMHGYWWDLSSESSMKRIEVLEKCIKETE